MGERTPVAVLDAPASGRLAVTEAITNILAADIDHLGDVRLSANWMAACGEPGEDAALYATVRAVGEELCPALGIAIPVGKDSLSMKTSWREADGRTQCRRAGVAHHFGVRPVGDVRRTLTPVLRTDLGPSSLWLIDLAAGQARALAAQCWRRSTGSSAGRRRIWMSRSCWLRCRGPCRNCAPRACCRRTTIVPMAGCW